VLAHRRQHHAGRAHCAHQVQLERRLPVGVRQLLEAPDVGAADVVHEAVDAPEAVEGFRDQPLGLARLREVGDDVQLTDPAFATARSDDVRALLDEQPRGLEADPARRARHDADLLP